MILRFRFSGAPCGLFGVLLLLFTSFGSYAQKAGDTSSTNCEAPLPLMLCVDLDGRASLDSAAGPLTYRWLMGDGTTLTGSVISHCYKERKNYVVQLDVLVDNTGEVRTGQKYIPIDLVDQDIVDFRAQPGRVRVGEAVTFAAPDAQLPTCQNVQLLWDFRDGTLARGRSVQHVFRRAGTYAVRFSMRGFGSEACVSSHCVTREVVVEP
jgi:PKD repeat protein